MPLTPIATDTLTDPHVAHGFFTRAGGVSHGIYEELNCGIGSDDHAVNVIENRALVAEHLAMRRDTPLLSCYQIHSDKVITVDASWTDDEKPKADAMVTNQPNIILGILTADCAPVLFYDPVARIIGAAHAGWQGALGGVLENTIAAMQALGATRETIRAAVGPTIAPKSYEVGADFYDTFIASDKDNSQFFWTGCDAQHHQFDLPHFIKARLECAGLKKIWLSDLDTYLHESLFFSYRRSCHKKEVDYGRQLSAIMLK